MVWSLNAVTIKLNYTINYNSFCSAALGKASGCYNYDLAFKQGGIFLTWLVSQAYFFHKDMEFGTNFTRMRFLNNFVYPKKR